MSFNTSLALLLNFFLTSKPDIWQWKWSSNCIYSIRSCYDFLLNEGVISPLEQWFWNLPILKKAKLFFWLAFHDKVLTKENLIKRGVATVENCLLCNESGETLNHLMLQYSYSRFYWHIIFSPFSSLDLPQSFPDVWVSWRHSHHVRSLSPALKCLFITVVWSLWKERNTRVFRFIATMPPATARKAISVYLDWLAGVPHPNVTRVLFQLS
ncbi:uncharacterized protein [Elaeis guineensis]|uniref:uncharacterized protein n=1 Tax=Elaeis guineensis var. tenera TaxID=51953 RepID=UPI003C6D4311